MRDLRSYATAPSYFSILPSLVQSGSESLLLEVDSGEAQIFYAFDGPIAAVEFTDDGKHLTVYQVPKDTDGDGQRSIPVANTTRALGPCVVPANSWGHYG